MGIAELFERGGQELTETVLPDAVRLFLTDDIGSVERLDVLLFLFRHAQRWWEAQKLSAELDMPAHSVQSHLEHLSARNLLEVRLAESVTFCCKPGNEELARLVEAVASTYYHRRDAVVSALARQEGSGSARLFADAFKFGRGKRG